MLLTRRKDGEPARARRPMKYSLVMYICNASPGPREPTNRRRSPSLNRLFIFFFHCHASNQTKPAQNHTRREKKSGVIYQRVTRQREYARFWLALEFGLMGCAASRSLPPRPEDVSNGVSRCENHNSFIRWTMVIQPGKQVVIRRTETLVHHVSAPTRARGSICVLCSPAGRRKTSLVWNGI